MLLEPPASANEDVNTATQPVTHKTKLMICKA